MKAWHIGLIGALALLAMLQATGVNDAFNRWLTDAHWRLAAACVDGFPPGIVIVAVDDATVERSGRLRYWSRGRYADLLAVLKDARAVGFDIIFAEPDRQDAAGDAAFAQAVRRHGRVVLPFFQQPEERVPDAGEQATVAAMTERFPRLPLDLSLLRDGSLLAHTSLAPPFPGLGEAARLTGFVEVNADADGVYRTPLLLKALADDDAAGKVLLPHLSLALAAVATDTSLAQAVSPELDRLVLGARDVPLDRGALHLQPIARRSNTAGAGFAVPTISFDQALQADPAAFKGSLVLVGETVTGTTDVRPNPLDNGLRGVELNAEILANLLALEPVVPLPTGWTLLAVVLALAVPLWLYETRPPLTATAGSLAAALVLLGLLETAFWGYRWVPSWGPVIGALGLATLLMAMQRVVSEDQAKRRIRDSFSMYVAPELVEEIARDPAIAYEEGRHMSLCVLFSDIRNFTTYCEANPPGLVVRQMREYMDEMAASVDTYQGVLDKFIGDAVMALFGPFLREGANCSALALGCAFDMQRRLDRLNEKWAAEGHPTLRIGIGLHFGEAIVGNIGSARRMQYTALGDTVNVAARLEGMTKELQSAVVASEAVKDNAGDVVHGHIAFRDLGSISVRNRAQPLQVYEAVTQPAESAGQEVRHDAA